MVALSYAEKWQTFLKRVFELSGGRIQTFVKVEAVIAPLDFDQAATESVVSYLLGKQFIIVTPGTTSTQMVALTVVGVDALQAARLI